MTDPNEIDREDVLHRTTLRVNGAGDQFDSDSVIALDVERNENRRDVNGEDHVIASTGGPPQQEVAG